ncbi:AraC family transcriptional regulator [Chitinophaga niastensis]|uniref:AraC family transcriptional regulator n=1 Tax=Chitinophaga niastensis TaxID=536980 RepID=A0A2P8HHM3_CHINA|nr:AraC family transcriptional regulator [Chitinophaga niastensis]PSL45680.1 AraC family transcriptional regulator [Chitinophaga niastensis]
MSFTRFQGEEITFVVCTENLPSSLAGYGLPHCCALHAYGDFGDMLFQEIPGNGFSIRYNNYLIRKEVTFSNVPDTPVLELHFSLKNNMHFLMEGIGAVVIHEMQYNLIYLPYLRNTSSFKADTEYCTFNIRFTTEYLHRFSDAFPSLHIFMQQVQAGKAGQLSPWHGYITAEMKGIIDSILHCNYTGEPRTIYIIAKVGELLLLALQRLEHPVGKNPLVLNEEDIEKLLAAKKWLENNMAHPCSLKELANRVGTNDFKLKKGFRQLFGTTVFDYLKEVRLDKALQLLYEMDTSIGDIAKIIGFRNAPNFIVAFKKKFGFPPGALKKKK